ncbi:MAG: glutamate--tRNA ligase [Solirubrobacterales bacterium]|nr:glutamate--tRNA ligase [Solirubrobacterales bacterium]HMT05149.1 glutamate--tRNA ligase [Solirubrobacterales bacterium]
MSIENSIPRVRFAPSPTGSLHIGGARTALYNWLAARHAGGELVLRIEDTDLERSTPENVAQILDALRWLELDWDEGPVSQVGRAEAHAAALEKLLESGAAYRDSATADDVKEWKAEHGADRGYRGTPSDDGTGAVRLRVPDDGDTVVNDLIRGEVRFPNRSYDDFVIARGDGSVLYNFAVAVDDADMGITDVIRGDDHLSNTPKQLLVFKGLGIEPPRYAHVPLLHGPDGKKLSKRHGAASVQELRDAGYLPEAIRNYVALLGWGPGDDETLLSTEELVKRFRPEDVGTSSAVFDEKKLRWMNGRYMRELPIEEYQTAVRAFVEAETGGRSLNEDRFAFGCEIVQEKAQTLQEVWPLIRFLFESPVKDEKAWRKVMKGDADRVLTEVEAALIEVPDESGGPNGDGFTVVAIQAALEPLPEMLGLGAGKVFQPIRVAITGTTISPGIFESVAALGRDETLARIENARAKLSQA